MAGFFLFQSLRLYLERIYLRKDVGEGEHWVNRGWEYIRNLPPRILGIGTPKEGLQEEAMKRGLLENACLWPHLMRHVPVRDVPAPEGRTGVCTQ